MSWPYIEFTVVRANNLLGRDANGLSDPYVMVWAPVLLADSHNLKDHKPHKTTYIKACLNPEWQTTFKFCKGLSHARLSKHAAKFVQEIKVQVWDYDKFTDHDFLGNAYVELGRVLEEKEFEAELELAPSSSCPDVTPTGTVTVRVRYVDPELEAAAAAAAAAAPAEEEDGEGEDGKEDAEPEEEEEEEEKEEEAAAPAEEDGDADAEGEEQPAADAEEEDADAEQGDAPAETKEEDA